jgi:large subunit ribosomal protein L10
VNRDEKAAVIEEVADQIRAAEAIFAVDYRGLSVQEAANLRTRLLEANATFRVVKNRLTIRAADAAGVESLKELLVGPTAFTFVAEDGDAAVAAKALAQFRRETDALAFKGGKMGEEILTIEQLEAISRLPARDVLHGQFVGVLASPLTTLVRGLAGMIGGLASQLQQLADQGLVSGAEPEPQAEAPAEAADEGPEATGQRPQAEEPEAEAPAEEEASAAEEPAADETEDSDTPSEGETDKEG